MAELLGRHTITVYGDALGAYTGALEIALKEMELSPIEASFLLGAQAVLLRLSSLDMPTSHEAFLAYLRGFMNREVADDADAE